MLKSDTVDIYVWCVCAPQVLASRPQDVLKEGRENKFEMSYMRREEISVGCGRRNRHIQSCVVGANAFARKAGNGSNE